MPLDVVETLKELIATPSVNPMGRDVSRAPYFETRLTEHLEGLFRRLGLATERQTMAPGRDNLIARLDGDVPPERGGGLILFDAHQDTVPVDGMTIEPFAPDVHDGRLYGRGACDTKGGMAAMLAALSRLAEERPAGMPTIVMACTVNEEYGFTGAEALARLWADETNALIPRTPDAAVIAEPTGLDVVVAHKGVVRWRAHTAGRAAHSAQPESGENAIYKMARLLAALERYQNEIVGSLASHPVCGPATLSVGTIHGGVSVNTVPDRCTIEIDRRYPPGETPEAAERHLRDYLRREAGPDFPVQLDPPFMCGLALSDDANGPLAERLQCTARDVTGRCNQTAVAYATNAAFYAAAGVPSVVFGPGSVDQAHTNDEWLALDQLEQAATIYYRFARPLESTL